MSTVLKIFLIIINLFVINFSNLNFYKYYQLSGYYLLKAMSYFCKNVFVYSQLILILFFNISIIFTNNFYIICLLNFLFLLIIFLTIISLKKQGKNRLVFTKRFTRIFTLTNIICFLYLFFLSFYIKNLLIFKYFLINFCLIFYFIFLISHILINPVECLVKKLYIKKAQKKLKKMPNLKVICLTGSFAKTSVKNILFEMLKSKYKVCKTQKSYNTQMGITKVILNDLKISDEILILEFGADHNHDIKKLCKIIRPDHIIITGVTKQHLKTFKTMQNLINTKFELVENMKENGFAVFNYDNEISKQFYNLCKSKNKSFVSLNEQNFNENFVHVENISCKFNKTEFNLCFNNKKIKCQTKLLGKHNILNILLASQMAINFGIELSKICLAIQNLAPTPHRLNLIENNGKFILDDSFNSNPEGAKFAIEVLKTFEGKKTVITPGLVELGKEQFVENVKLGKLLKDIDFVLITNFVNKKALLKGLENSKNQVFCFESLLDATKKLKALSSDCILFLNDLPDNYK